MQSHIFSSICAIFCTFLHFVRRDSGVWFYLFGYVPLIRIHKFKVRIFILMAYWFERVILNSSSNRCLSLVNTVNIEIDWAELRGFWIGDDTALSTEDPSVLTVLLSLYRYRDAEKRAAALAKQQKLEAERASVDKTTTGGRETADRDSVAGE